MDLGLAGKVALVAGGSSGLGLAAAQELAREGTHVAIGARDRGRLAAAQRAVEAVAPGKVSASSVDITDARAAREWVEAVAAEFGALHIVLVSGGSPPFGPADMFAFDAYEAAVRQVLGPAVELTLAALPHLKAAGWGRLIYIASETACVPVAPLALSGVTRAALVRFAQGIAAEVGRDGITANVLAPGGTRTPPMERMAARLAAQAGAGPGGAGDAGAAAAAAAAAVEAELLAMGHHSAVGRLARPDEVAAMAAFLASERASYITGTVHLIDGGAAVLGPDLLYLAAMRKEAGR